MIEFYMSAVGIFLTIITALIAAWLSWRFSTAITRRSVYRVWIASVVTLVVVAAMTWDVVRTSITMAQLCPQAGVHVKRAVRVTGFYTNSGGPDDLKMGFEYVEVMRADKKINVYYGDKLSIRKDERSPETYQIKSQYEFIYSDESGSFRKRDDIGLLRSVVRNRETKEELGYALKYYAYPGWVDRHTLSLLTQVLWACPSYFGSEASEMRNQVLLPAGKGG